ncbi:MAG: hypothetical protein L0241_05350 [Planctomycetia bacterium]|nr:hypothetical protein [Planctomycetia bacterium]
MNKLPLALLVLLVAFATARADIGPPPGKKIIPVTTVVEVTDSFPDYAFFEISWSSTPGPPPHGGASRSVTLHFFVPGSSIKDTGARRSGSRLYAVPTSVAEKLGWKGFAADAAKNSPTAHSTVSAGDEQWFELARSINAGEVPGAIAIPFGTTEEAPTNDTRTAITVEYRVVRTPAGVEFVRPDELTPTGTCGERAEGGNTESESTIPWRWIVAGGAASAALVLGGVWFARRQFRRPSTQPVA